ncbi:hypothetical protein IMZ48_11285, partial [Candidatus Bathyarchaeota archaeon]|nr:hypothetical protein [Candidatus Bathyarchaeota archaeon]
MPVSAVAGKPKALLASEMSVQSKSILRHPGNGKRRADVLEANDGDEMPSTPKRRKVIFSDSGPIVHEVGGRTLADVRAEVRRTLDRHRRGDDDEYSLLKRHFNMGRRGGAHDDYDEDEPPIKPQELTQYLLALASCAPTFKEKPFRDLANTVLNCTWVGRDERFAQAYIEFLAALASVGAYLHDSLAIVFEFFAETRRSSWSVAGYADVSKFVVEDRLHAALRRLLRVSPAAVRSVMDVAKTKYPVQDDDKRTHASYVDNLLRIRDYAPALGRNLLNLVVEQLVNVDVNMQTDLDDLDDELTTAVHRALAENQVRALETADDDDESDEESDDEDDDEGLVGLHKIKSVRNHIEVLDVIMDTSFKFYAPYFDDPHSETAISQCKMLLSQFTDIILPMRKSRHTQFLLFHFVQKSDQLTSMFIETCERIAFSSAPSVLGDYAVAYLASFLARGAHIPAYLVQNVFRKLLLCLERRRATYEKTCQGPNITKYYSYYALCQATFYIFCFRWKDLVVSAPEIVDPEDPLSYVGQDLDWGENTRRILKNNAHAKLNPLKVCSPGIVEEFAKLAHKLNLVYVYPVLEINKRVRLA